MGGKSLSSAPAGLRYFGTWEFKICPLSFLKGRGNELSCHRLLSTRLAVTCVWLFNNTSSSGTSWSPRPIKVFFLSLPLSACCQSARLYQRPLKAPPPPLERPANQFLGSGPHLQYGVASGAARARGRPSGSSGTAGRDLRRRARPNVL